MAAYERARSAGTHLAVSVALFAPLTAFAQVEPTIAPSFPTPSEIIEERLQEGADQQELYRQSCNSVVTIETSDPLGSTLIT
ncbi:MAG: hypothetical protein O3C21_21150, partial [Verrucomicrobia bacterium]|nr:hypothetical protein [Verrucomicrobiota bacterium]